MKTLLVFVFVLWATLVQAQPPGYFGTGFPIIAIDNLTIPPINDGPYTFNGFTFHIGGAAITQLNVYLDCDPYNSTTGTLNPDACPKMEPILWYRRADIVGRLAPYRIDVPDMNGIAFGGVSWLALAEGEHWLYMFVTEVEHGRQGWYRFTKRFAKATFTFGEPNVGTIEP